MLAEKLLLHVLIILAPVLIYYVVSENRRFGQSPYLIGILQGISASLCLLFSFYDYGIYWDLRYIPLVLAILYGGPKAGIIVVAALLGTRTFLGGDAIEFGYVSGLLAASIPFLMLKHFNALGTRKKRIGTAVLCGLWINLVMLAILVAYWFLRPSIDWEPNITIYLLSYGFFTLSGMWITSTLHEAVLERELMKQEIRRAEKLNTLGELAASIAHEVRNPLTVVKGFLQLMHKDEKGKNHQFIGLVLSELARAESIINDYLSFAKPEFKKIEKVDLAELLHDVKLLLNPLAIKNGVHLESYLEKNVTMDTDKNQFKQALVNVLKNAIEATPQDGRVYIKLFSNVSGIQILIKDTGKGMTKEQVSRIGTLFYTTKDKGTGLGTTVSMRIVDTMNGKMVYTSEVGKGTEVKISFPPVKKEERKTAEVG